VRRAAGMRRVLRFCGLALLGAALTGCSGSSDQPTKVAAAAPALAVSTAPRQAAEDFTPSGPIVVENQLDVVAQREGVISKLNADVGTPVRRGQLLAQIDDRQVTADRDAAAAKVKSLEADVKGWDYETKVLQTDLDRSEKMMQAQLITQQQLEHDRYKVQADKYETERAQQNLINAQETLKSLNLELEKTRITAPFDGVVARRYVRDGQKVAVGDRIFWVTAVAPLRVRFTLPERFAGHVKAGDQLSVASASEPAEQHEAKIISVSPVVDPASGTIEAVAEITGNSGTLRPGMTANIHLKNQQ